MNFEFTPEQEEAAALAARILGDRTSLERLRAVESGGDRHDHELWQELAAAGLLSLAVPEEHGGAGLGLLELCRVVVEVGRVVAPVPVGLHGACMLAISELGSSGQAPRWLPGAASGERLLTAAVAEDLEHLPAHPTTRATRTGDGWRIDGGKTVVRAGTHADLYLVTAATPSGTGVFLVEPDSEGLVVEAQSVTGGETAARLELHGVRLPDDALLGDADGAAAHRLHHLLTVVVCAEALGVTEGALALTAAYAREREQFGRPIGTFQAVSQRLADGYIETLGQRLTLWQAAWRLSEGLEADAEVAAAKLWAADAAHRIAHTTVHVHGGVGIDLDGTAHRYFSAAKRLEFTCGGSTGQALAIGRSLAAEPA